MALLQQDIIIKLMLDIVTKIYHDNLKKTPEALGYLESRGINGDSILKFKIGYCDNNIAASNLYSKYSSEEMLSSGVFHEKDGKVLDLFYGRITIPIIVNGEIVSMTGRSVGERHKVKHMHASNIKIKHAFNQDILKKSKYVVVVEGPFDCITLDQNNIASIGVLGNQRITHEIISDLNNKEIYICFDSDPNHSGQKAAVKLAEKLAKFSLKSRIIVLPYKDQKVDVNSYFQNNTVKDFKKIVFQSKLYNKRQEAPKKKTYEECKADILKVMSQYLEIRNGGTRYKAVCPFHGDNDPSLVIYLDTNSYYCFGCGAHGNAAKFIKEIEALRGNRINYFEAKEMAEKI